MHSVYVYVQTGTFLCQRLCNAIMLGPSYVLFMCVQLDVYTQTLGIWCQFHKVVAEQLDLKRKQYEDMKLVFTPSMFAESERASELNQEIINLEHAMHEILHRFCLEGLRPPVERYNICCLFVVLRKDRICFQDHNISRVISQVVSGRVKFMQTLRNHS